MFSEWDGMKQPITVTINFVISELIEIMHIIEVTIISMLMLWNQNKHIFELQDPNYSYVYIEVIFLPFDLGRHHARY